MPLRSLQSRIVALVLALIVVVQAGAFLLIEVVGGTTARSVIEDDLAAGARVFDRLIEEDGLRLLEAARTLAKDDALREAAAPRNRNTMRPVLVDRLRRAEGDIAMVIGLDDRIVAHTSTVHDAERFVYPDLLRRARLMQHASGMVIVDGKLHHIAVVPVLSPAVAAWVAVGREVDDVYAQDLRGLTRLDLSILWHARDEAWALQASTLPEAARLPLLADASAMRLPADGQEGTMTLSDDVVARVIPLRSGSDATAVALLQHPLASTLEPFRRLQRQLAWTSLLALALSVLAGILVARSIARPVRELALAARRMAAGDYSPVPSNAQPEEIAELAAAFDTMQKGIASREARIMDLAYRDPLTGLPNRTLCRERLTQAVDAARAAGTRVGVLVMDLDHFKYVNDALGHPIGDLLLREVAERLRALPCARDGVVARLGGDEFALLLPGATAADAEHAAASVLAALEAPMTPADQIVHVRASIGIALHPDHGDEAETLLRHADVAMYVAKRNGGGMVAFDERHDPHSRERLALMGDLRHAVDEDQLTLVYQPKIAMTAASGHHVEALVRWRHPSRGLVAPGEFIPFAEQTGYIRTITQWVVKHAIAQCAAWRAQGIAMHISINISARDVMDPQLPDRIAALLAEHGCAPRWISFEITESALLDDPEHAVGTLERLHALGCQIAIDDFGTGYSSLAYLRRLPLTELKIDKSFVLGMARDADDEAIVRSTISLAHDMRLRVVAEGVEDEATLARLRSLGCDMAQGYLMSPPVGPLQITAWLRESPWAAAAPAGKELRRTG
ncbi:MAG TPA: EAL domain-containing protein [Casimicrobiaceae bacterium]|nr:EAL domain-containing protein [Casimicrobiaceae bacterium]